MSRGGRAPFLLAGVSFALAAPRPAPAQTMRDYEYSRPVRGEQRLRAVVEFAAGRLSISPAQSGDLYRLALRYDADRFDPIGSYAAGEVRLGVRGNGRGGIRVDRRSALPQIAAVELSPKVDLVLDVAVGAADGTLELGGLRLTGLAMKTGASRTAVGFSSPNPVPCDSAHVGSGAGELTITGMGNGGCRTWEIEGGVGAVTLDLAGAWRSDARIGLNLALGGVTLRAPRALGLRVRVGGFLAGFEASGFTREGKVYTSANYERAARKIEVEVNSALGGVTVEWK